MATSSTTFSSVTSSITTNSDSCLISGGVREVTGGCTCAPGWTSSYDALLTNVFCTVPTEYSTTAAPGNFETTPVSSDSSIKHSVTFFGVVQLVILFCISMLVVCVFRGAVRCCRQSGGQSQLQPMPQPSPYFFPVHSRTPVPPGAFSRRPYSG